MNITLKKLQEIADILEVNVLDFFDYKIENNEDLDLLKQRLSGYKDLNGIYLEKIDYLQNRLDDCQSEKKRV